MPFKPMKTALGAGTNLVDVDGSYAPRMSLQSEETTGILQPVHLRQRKLVGHLCKTTHMSLCATFKHKGGEYVCMQVQHRGRKKEVLFERDLEISHFIV